MLNSRYNNMGHEARDTVPMTHIIRFAFYVLLNTQ